MAICLGASVLGCSTTSRNFQEPTTTTTKRTLSIDQKKAIAERAAVRQVLATMREDVRYSGYDIDATRFNIGAITEESGMFTVNGTLSLYDKYGRFKRRAIFSGNVSVNSDGIYRSYPPKIIRE